MEDNPQPTTPQPDPGQAEVRRHDATQIVLVAIVLLIVLILFVILAIQYHRHRLRATVSRVRSDHRMLATAIETYYVDCMQYPSFALAKEKSILGPDYPDSYPPFRTFHKRRAQDQLMTLTTPIAYLNEFPSDPFADLPGTPYPFYCDNAGWILGSWGPDADQSTGGDLLWHYGDEQTPIRARQQYLTEETLAIIAEHQKIRPSLPIPFGVANPDEWDILPDPGVEAVYNARIRQPSDDLLTGSSRMEGYGAFTYDPTNGNFSEGDIWRVKQ